MVWCILLEKKRNLFQNRSI